MAPTSTGERTRGRPREFDEDAVLDTVIELFREQGFEAASLADITEATGLNKSSLYNAFGSKDELFQRALDRYVDQRLAMLAMATSGDGGLDDLLALVEFVRAEALSDEFRSGCLAVNSAAELGYTSDAVARQADRFRDQMRASVAVVLDRAAQLGEIDPAMVGVYADTFMGFMLTTALFVRGGSSHGEITAYVDSLAALVGSWRRPPT